MRRFGLSIAALAAAISFAACERQEPAETGESTGGAVEIPLTTESTEAREHYAQGMEALDMGRSDAAIPHFDQAIAADPDFAMAYLRRANAANSLADFQRNLEMAVERAEGASEAEVLMIEAARRAFDDDLTGRLEAAERLVEIQPATPRAWMTLANAQSAMGDEEAARASLRKTVEVAPGFAPGYMALGNSYLFVEPRDLAQAQRHMARAVELAPDEAVPHDLLGDAYRGQGMLEEAAGEYTRTAELDPESGSGFQQRGHVNSFLGHYEQARADFDASIEIEEGKNLAASFRVYRAFVSVHEGNPGAAIEELETLVGEIDGMGIPEPVGQKLFALESIARIAMHAGMYDAARSAIERRAALATAQAEETGVEAARRDARAETILYQGELAARQGEYAAATARAEEYMQVMESSADSRKDEPAHALLGLVALDQGNHAEAIAHFEQADPNDIYAAYYHATALEGAGRADEAKAMYQNVATNYFNSAEYALVRQDAAEKAGS